MSLEKKRYVQIGVALEEDTVHIPDLAFVPVGAVEQADDGGDGGDLVGVGLDTDAGLVGVGEKVVDDLGRVSTWRDQKHGTHLEPAGLCGEVDCGDVDDLAVLALGVVPEEGEDGDDRLGGDVEGELVLVDGELLHVSREGGEDVLPVLVQRGLGPGHCLGGVHADWLLEGRSRWFLQPARGHGE